MWTQIKKKLNLFESVIPATGDAFDIEITHFTFTLYAISLEI